MGIEAYFKGSRVLGTIIGKGDEYFNITRSNRTSSVSGINNVFKALLQRGKETQVVDGDIVNIDSEVYFVVAMRSSHTGTTMCQLRRTNCTIDIVELKKHFTGSIQDYIYESPRFTDIPAYYEEVTAKMQQYDLGLLAKTTKKFLVSDEIALKVLDRIKLNNDNAQVDSISTSQYPGLLWVQCSNDTRPYKVI